MALKIPISKRTVFVVLLVLLSIFTSLVLLELILRAASIFYNDERQVHEPLDKDKYIILAIGDSHTYGIGVELNETYPSLLERMLNKDSEKYSVLNLGQAGINSAKVSRKIQDYIDYYKPKMIIVLVGANDVWNKEGLLFGSDRVHYLSYRLSSILYHFKTYKLYKLIMHNFLYKDELKYKGQPELLGNTGYTMIKTEDGFLIDYSEPARDSISIGNSEITYYNLVDIINVAKQNNVKPVLMTYPIANEPTSNTIISAALKNSADLIDNERYFRKLDPGYNQYYIDKAHHLNKQGYVLMAYNIYDYFIEKEAIK